MRNIIRFDWAIKRLLRNKANFGILEGFLSELLGEDIKIESILESESNRETSANKANRVDMLVQDAKGEPMIIEVQASYMRDYLMRMLFGTSKLIVDNMEAGMLYEKIKKIISVNVVYFDLGHGEDYVYHGVTQFIGMNKNDVLELSKQEQLAYHTEEIKKIYPEYYIIKVNQFNDNASNTLDEWINFLKNEEVKEGSKAKGLSEAREKLDVMKLSREEKAEYDRYIANWRDNESALISNYEAGELKGIEKGIEQGEKKKATDIAANCLRKGMSVEDTAALTGLSIEEVRGIIG